jgi:hypothetical protein
MKLVATYPDAMDPISALSVASAVVQFVDFSSKAVSAIIKIYRSLGSENSLRNFDELQRTAEILRSANVRLKDSLEPARLNRLRTDTETDIVAVATECIEVSVPLLDTLRQINVDRDTNSFSRLTRLRAIRASVKAIWNQDKMDALEHRLKDSREQLILVILLNIR